MALVDNKFEQINLKDGTCCRKDKNEVRNINWYDLYDIIRTKTLDLIFLKNHHEKLPMSVQKKQILVKISLLNVAYECFYEKYMKEFGYKKEEIFSDNIVREGLEKSSNLVEHLILKLHTDYIYKNALYQKYISSGVSFECDINERIVLKSICEYIYNKFKVIDEYYY